MKAFIDKVPAFMMKNVIVDTFKSGAELMINRGEDFDLVRKVRKYGKKKAFPRSKQIAFLEEKNDPSSILTIIHGDVWSNNLMYDDPDDPKKIKLIDYQMLTRRHPARDLFYYFYNSTDRAFRLAIYLGTY